VPSSASRQPWGQPDVPPAALGTASQLRCGASKPLGAAVGSGSSQRGHRHKAPRDPSDQDTHGARKSLFPPISPQKLPLPPSLRGSRQRGGEGGGELTAAELHARSACAGTQLASALPGGTSRAWGQPGDSPGGAGVPGPLPGLLWRHRTPGGLFLHPKPHTES